MIPQLKYEPLIANDGVHIGVDFDNTVLMLPRVIQM